MITVSDIATRHPKGLRCKTDQAYAKLADKIFQDLNYRFIMVEKERNIHDASISIALYFEDLMSGTHQMEVFEKLYKKMFGFYMPFFESESASSPTAELDAMTFVLWHSLSGYRDGQVWNPSNDDLRNTAKSLLELFKKEKKKLPTNDDLAGYLFSEETQENPYEVRDILVWIESRSFLGKWLTNLQLGDNNIYLELMEEVLKSNSEKLLQDNADCLGAFMNQAWPISLSAAEIYAEMIRTEMEDPDDTIAAQVEKIDSSLFNPYRINKVEGTLCHISDNRGNDYKIQFQPKDDIALVKKSACIVCGLFSYKGLWYPNGMYKLFGADSKMEFDGYTEMMSTNDQISKERNDAFEECSGIAKKYVEKKSGEHLFFFKKHSEMAKLCQNLFGPAIKIPETGNKFLMFIYPDGGMEFRTCGCEVIKHPDNPYYDKSYAQANALMPWETENMSAELALYVVQNDLVPDASFYDFRGNEHGRLLFQDNIDFMVRCIRRDIKSKDVFHKRNGNLFADFEKSLPETAEGKKPYMEFVKEINDNPFFKSRGAQKEWKIKKCNADTTIIRDEDKDKEYSIPTQKLYEAYVTLKETEMKAERLIPFVGKSNAPAATALLYNIAGTGSGMNAIRKLATYLSLLSGKM